MIENRDLARGALDGRAPIPAVLRTSQVHIRMLLSHLRLDGVSPDLLAIQLTAALESPLLLYLSTESLTSTPAQIENDLSEGWRVLIERVCRP